MLQPTVIMPAPHTFSIVICTSFRKAIPAGISNHREPPRDPPRPCHPRGWQEYRGGRGDHRLEHQVLVQTW
jgi:hypothetical protein